MSAVTFLKLKRTVSIISLASVAYFFGATSIADSTPLKAVSISQSPDAPVMVTYDDGRIAQIVRKETVEEFRVPVILSENSCRPGTGLKCNFVLPFIRQSFAAVWKKHPDRAGQPLQYKFDKNLTFGTQVIITRTQNQLFENILSRNKSGGGDLAKINAAIKDKSLGRLECESDVANILPEARSILFWDENFENGNTELAISEGMGPRINLFWRRYQNTKIIPQDKVMQIAPFEMDYGTLTNYYPTGLSYTMLMSFRGANIEQPQKPYCSLKWTVDFSNYFSQVTRVLSGGGFQAFNPVGYVPATYTTENVNPYAQLMYKKETWEAPGVE